MHILEVCFSPALGGLELYCLNTAARLRARGHRVSLWLAKDSRMAGQVLAKGGSELPPYQLFRAPGYINPFFTLMTKHLLRERGIDIIHLHRSQDLALFAPINIPKVLTLQIQSSLPKRDLWHRWIYSRVDRILTITHLMRDLALKTLPVSPDKIHALHYGIAADELYAQRGNCSDTRQKFGIPKDSFLIGIIGRLEESKGQEVLLRAFAQIHQKYQQAHLVLAGDPPPEHQGYDRRLRELTRNLNIAERVHFIGFQADTPLIFAMLDLFILASKQEAFGLVLLEAMAQGIPIIATRAGGVPEVIEDGVNGLLVNSGDAAELAGAIERLMGDVELRKRLGEAGFRAVRERFGIEMHLIALERHFEEVIQPQRRHEGAMSAKK